MQISWSRPNMIIFLVLCMLLNFHWSCQDVHEETIAQWDFVKFLYPNKTAEANDIAQGRYREQDVIIFDVNRIGNRTYITTPAFTSGTPATLSTLEIINGEYLLKPFPGFPDHTNDETFCQGLVSVGRTWADKCNTLWVIDSGRFDVLGKKNLTCTPKILAYKDDREIFRIDIPKSILFNNSLLLTIITASSKSDCSDTNAYIADLSGHQIVIFDYANKDFWYVRGKVLENDSAHGTLINSQGVNVTVRDGPIGLSIDYQRQRLLFNVLSGVHEGWGYLNDLNNKSLVESEQGYPKRIYQSEGEKPSQSTLEATTQDGILIFPVIKENTFYCWNSKTPFVPSNLHSIYRNDTTIQFVGGMKLYNNDTQLLYVSNHFIDFSSGNRNGSDIKYRVMQINNIDKILDNSPCRRGDVDSN